MKLSVALVLLVCAASTLGQRGHGGQGHGGGHSGHVDGPGGCDHDDKPGNQDAPYAPGPPPDDEHGSCDHGKDHGQEHQEEAPIAPGPAPDEDGGCDHGKDHGKEHHEEAPIAPGPAPDEDGGCEHGKDHHEEAPIAPGPAPDEDGGCDHGEEHHGKGHHGKDHQQEAPTTTSQPDAPAASTTTSQPAQQDGTVGNACSVPYLPLLPMTYANMMKSSCVCACDALCQAIGYASGEYCTDDVLAQPMCHCVAAVTSKISCEGDPHCITTDGLNVSPQNADPYVVLQKIGAQTDIFPAFSLFGSNNNYAGNAAMTVWKAFEMDYMGDSIVLTSQAINSTAPIVVNGVAVTKFPWTHSNPATQQYMRIVQVDSQNTILYTDFGMQLRISPGYPYSFTLLMPNLPRNSLQLSGFYGSLYEDGNPLNDLFYRNGTLVGNQIADGTYIMRNSADEQTLITVYQRTNVPHAVAQAYLQSWAVTAADKCSLGSGAVSALQSLIVTPTVSTTCAAHAASVCAPLDINNAASPFANCIKSSADATNVALNKFNNCKMDVCAYAGVNDPSAPAPEDGACTMLTGMEAYCIADANVPLTGTWRAAAAGGFCYVACNTGETFSACMLAPTCQHPDGSLHPDHENHCTAGCQCGAGLVRDTRTNACVTTAQCSQPAAPTTLAFLPRPPRKHCAQC